MDGFVKSMGELFGKMSFLPNNEMRAAFLGAFLIIGAFLLAWLASLISRMSGLRKKLYKTTVKLSELERVDEDNVEFVYAELKKLPEPTAKGWGRYLEDRKNYPSDYIAARDVLDKREYNGKNTVGKILYVLLSMIVWVVCALAVGGLCKEDLASVGITDISSNFSTVASIICSVVIPVAVFAALYFVLDYIYGRQRKRLEMSFASFQDVLDEKVVIPDREDEEYSDDELSDITKEVDEMLAGHMDDDEIPFVITEKDEKSEEDMEEEVISEPEIEPEIEEIIEEEPQEVEEVAEEVVEEETSEEEPVEEITEEEYAEETAEAAAEEAPEPFIPMTKEEAERYLSVLLVVVDSAMADPETSDEDLEEIAVLIETARLEAFRDPEDQQILEECLIKLASRWRE